MSAARQILLSLMVIAVALGGWLAYDAGYFAPGGDGAVAGLPPGGGPAGSGPQGGGSPGGGPPGGGFPGGGGGFARGASPVIAATVVTDDAVLEVHAIGTVAAVRAVTLYPQVAGVVAEVSFRPGTGVEAGDALIRLEDADHQVAVERARLALDSARAALARSEQLARSNNISTVALTEAETAVRQAEIDLRSAEIELAKRTLTAPFAGTTGLSDITVGDLVNSSRAIVTLDDMSTVTVAFDVPERASGRVAVGQEIVATTAALAGRHFTGHVSAVDSRVDPVARTLKVEASLPNEANVLKPGMALNVALSFEGVDQPAVASLAVQWDRSGPYVWKVEGESVVRVGVDIVGRRSGVVIVAAGDLAAGDEVVVEGLQRLRDGSRVRRLDGNDGVVPAASPEAEGGGAEADATAEGRRQPSG